MPHSKLVFLKSNSLAAQIRPFRFKPNRNQNHVNSKPKTSDERLQETTKGSTWYACANSLNTLKLFRNLVTKLADFYCAISSINSWNIWYGIAIECEFSIIYIVLTVISAIGAPCPDNIMLWNAVIFGPGECHLTVTTAWHFPLLTFALYSGNSI